MAISLITPVSEINKATHLNTAYRTVIHYNLSQIMRREAAECLATTKGWSMGELVTPDIDTQCTNDKLTKILQMEHEGVKITIHCQCRYMWRATTRWQYGYNNTKDSQLWIYSKHQKSDVDYLALMNRQLNQMILIPKSEINAAKKASKRILNKITDKYVYENIALVQYYGNENLEYFSRPYGSDESIWTTKHLSGRDLT